MRYRIADPSSKGRYTVLFRGQPTEVIFEDMGAEPECNAHVIEWHFADDSLNALVLTDDEEQDVYDQFFDRSL